MLKKVCIWSTGQSRLMIYGQSYQWSEDIEIMQQMRAASFTPAEQQLIIKLFMRIKLLLQMKMTPWQLTKLVKEHVRKYRQIFYCHWFTYVHWFNTNELSCSKHDAFSKLRNKTEQRILTCTQSRTQDPGASGAHTTQDTTRPRMTESSLILVINRSS